MSYLPSIKEKNPYHKGKALFHIFTFPLIKNPVSCNFLACNPIWVIWTMTVISLCFSRSPIKFGQLWHFTSKSIYVNRDKTTFSCIINGGGKKHIELLIIVKPFLQFSSNLTVIQFIYIVRTSSWKCLSPLWDKVKVCHNWFEMCLTTCSLYLYNIIVRSCMRGLYLYYYLWWHQNKLKYEGVNQSLG